MQQQLYKTTTSIIIDKCYTTTFYNCSFLKHHFCTNTQSKSDIKVLKKLKLLQVIENITKFKKVQ